MTNFSAFCSLVAAGAVAALPMTVLAQASDPWIVGEIAALSGPAATVGIRLNESTKLWAEQITDDVPVPSFGMCLRYERCV